MRNVTELSKLNGKVYVYLRGEVIARRFLQDAENEGFTFGDGEKPTARLGNNLYVVNRDWTISHVGWAGHMAYIAENVLNREFKSDKPNEKWLTDVSEFKYGTGDDKKKGKIYLSVILDLCGKRPVAYEYSDHNNNPLVFNTFDKALAANPGATPLFHSDRGYQYTSKTFRQKIIDAGMNQSMSRVARCIDNGPMEGFWGIMKREMYYGRKYPYQKGTCTSDNSIYRLLHK